MVLSTKRRPLLDVTVLVQNNVLLCVMLSSYVIYVLIDDQFNTVPAPPMRDSEVRIFSNKNPAGSYAILQVVYGTMLAS